MAAHTAPQRFGRVQKATALVPLALLSAAWTASIAGAGALSTAAVSSPTTQATLPDGTSVPVQAIEDAASVSSPGVLAPAVAGRAGAADVVRTASPNGIPAAALAAYQRAETVINAADEACGLDWELLAAIGRVESDHGRYGGNVLDDDGVARPGIRGIALDGSNGTAAIADTDAGQYDDDGVWDRAVGPMQFIPSTWSVVGVDADGDGTRNPQDVDDAALASAVYLCSGDDDLATDAGRRDAVFRYNNSDAYVDLVLSVMEAYQQGDFSAVPNGTTSAAYFVPDTTAPSAPAKARGGAKGPGKGQTASAGQPPATAEPQPEPAPEQPAPEQPAPAPTPAPTKPLQETVKDVVKDPTKVVRDPGGTVEDVLTPLEAQTQCLASGISKLDVVGLAACVEELLNP
ncbi:lytic murein transglycosylase [Nocardioides perillae]|uniref:Membrane-bound lytic murein transglycosylase B n=1 Tax=Nocardioides perillae TaxID=1119534 RepID=A0A7Y9RRT4_9ACTN|nr:lytic murein transglycosylase [Nocardioides perillae]NYG53778.1 membrane-bound lytic murein transglycosylase B [Nocardioides perillae]